MDDIQELRDQLAKLTQVAESLADIAERLACLEPVGRIEDPLLTPSRLSQVLDGRHVPQLPRQSEIPSYARIPMIEK